MRKRILNNIHSILAAVTVTMSVAAGMLIMSAIVGEEATAAVSGAKAKTESATEVPIGDFSGIDITSAIDIVFTQGKATGKAKVVASDSGRENLVLKVKDGVLVARYAGTDNGNLGNTVITVTSPRLNYIKASGAATVTVSGLLTLTENLNVDATTASSVSLGEVSGDSISIQANTASNVFMLVTDAANVNVNASTAADVKLRGMNVGNVKAIASTAAGITLSGRCNKSEVSSATGGVVRTRGLILEQLPISRRQENDNSSSVAIHEL